MAHQTSTSHRPSDVTGAQSSPGAERHSSRMANLRECTSNSMAKLDQCVSHYPVSTILVTLGAGLGIGLVLGAYLATPGRTGSWNRRTAEGLGRRTMDAVAHVLPHSISERLPS